MITIDEVKKLNAERTSGKWVYDQEHVGDDYYDISVTNIDDVNICGVHQSIHNQADKAFQDMAFIAASPDIANLAIQLSEENERLLKFIEENWPYKQALSNNKE
jgi:hypothetical protein